MKWVEGRQGSGYKKLLVAQGKWWDCYLIDYPPHTHIPTHTDPVPGKRHFRLNILLQGADNFRGKTILSFKRIKLFRPDISPHSVEEVPRRRLVLSIGWVL